MADHIEPMRISISRGELEIASMWAFSVPRVGESVYVSFHEVLMRPDLEAVFQADSVAHWRKFDGTWWIVESVEWCHRFDYEGRTRTPSATCRVRKEGSRG